jgi:hypothetical protein
VQQRSGDRSITWHCKDNSSLAGSQKHLLLSKQLLHMPYTVLQLHSVSSVMMLFVEA